MQLFGRQNRKALREIKTHLIAKNRSRSGTGTVTAICAIVKDVLKKIKICTHRRYLISFIQNAIINLYQSSSESHDRHTHILKNFIKKALLAQGF